MMLFVRNSLRNMVQNTAVFLTKRILLQTLPLLEHRKTSNDIVKHQPPWDAPGFYNRPICWFRVRLYGRCGGRKFYLNPIFRRCYITKELV